MCVCVCVGVCVQALPCQRTFALSFITGEEDTLARRQYKNIHKITYERCVFYRCIVGLVKKEMQSKFGFINKRRRVFYAVNKL